MSAARLASPRLMAGLAALSVMAFCAIMVLVAFGEDLKPRDRAGPHAFSRSASGYRGLTRLLEATDRPWRITRRAETLQARASGLIVLTPFGYASGDLDTLAGPALIVLPKWDFEADKRDPGLEGDTFLLSESLAAAGLGDVAGEVRISRIRPLARLRAPWGEMTPQFDEVMQLISGDRLDPVIATPAGALLAQVRGSRIYILADPDPLANHGIDVLANARFAIGLLDWLRQDEEIVFDVTLAGYSAGDNGLKALLTPPLLGATLTGLAGAVLLFWAALSVFGARRREAPAIRLGKGAIIDSTTGLFAMARREGHMAPGFLELQRERLRRELALPRGMARADFTALIDRLARERGLSRSFSDWEREFAAPLPNRQRLAEAARAFHLWTRELLS